MKKVVADLDWMSSFSQPLKLVQATWQTFGDTRETALAENSSEVGMRTRTACTSAGFAFVTRDEFENLLPARPFCTDGDYSAMSRQSRHEAADRRMIQPNATNLIRWLTFDIDRAAAWYAWEEGRLPYPNFIAVNQDNGHAHIAYELAAPVSVSSNSSHDAVQFLEAVQRGFTRRLRADRGYAGFLCKNPVHPHWLTDWQSGRPYELHVLNEALDPADRRKATTEPPTGFGRNCAIFDLLREASYRQVLIFKKAGKTEAEFRKFLENVSVDVNRKFNVPLYLQELSQIAKSVAKWSWTRFSPERFSAIQSARGKKAWSKTETLSKSKPWEAEGISRRTWFKRRCTKSISDIQ